MKEIDPGEFWKKQVSSWLQEEAALEKLSMAASDANLCRDLDKDRL